MTDDGVKQRGLAYAEYLSRLSPEERARINERMRKRGEEEHKAFHEKFQEGQCWVCGDACIAANIAKLPELLLQVGS